MPCRQVPEPWARTVARVRTSGRGCLPEFSALPVRQSLWTGPAYQCPLLDALWDDDRIQDALVGFTEEVTNDALTGDRNRRRGRHVPRWHYLGAEGLEPS
jgi:hypothetical protein